MRLSKKVLLIGVTCCLAVLLLAGVYIGYKYSECFDDFKKLKSEEYDTVFFSMYPIDHYDEADYEYLRGMHILKTSFVMPDTSMMKWYMDAVYRSGNTVNTVYLGIDPENADIADIALIVQNNPGIEFEIVLAYPEMTYWLEMNEEKCDEVLMKYRNLTGSLLELANVRVYYFGGAEWLICNPKNYAGPSNTNESVSEIIMGNSDFLHPYMLDLSNLEVNFNQVKALIEQYRTDSTYIDASEWEIVFFGDSIFGNYQGSLSLPGVVNSLTNAAVYNCGYGGRSAALSQKTEIPLPAIVDAFIQQDLSVLPETEQVYRGVEEYIQADTDKSELMFVINYGLNDYYDGLPVATEDSYDITSYIGAIRTGVMKLQEEYPDAEIILQTPNFTTYYEYGTVPQSEVGGMLEDYVNALIELAEELDVHLLDNYRDLKIDKENHLQFLADGCHFNEQGRFLAGTHLITLIEKVIQGH